MLARLFFDDRSMTGNQSSFPLYIDVAFRLIRERLWLFSKTYRKNVVLADTVYIACMNDHFQRGWAEVDGVYYPLNIGSNHWVLVQIDLPAHMLMVYDSDQALYDDAHVEQAIRPMMKMLPYFLLNVEGVTDCDDLDLTTTTKLRDFDVRRLPPNVVPQTTKSGDRSIFVVKHLECLLADIPLSNVVDDVMQHSRQKLCVDLFYQNIEP
ncbi:Ulp1 protease family, C-terminal catalytic domain containing protein [Parasponia andersonii]|uniref:Ulp1 protease family, C-terminal catalytic domain containing protein n=1 Tax=Parasponia andersonii TaxID=3476 RepID=A0A2P5B8K3_PARAD|nr:Ulp1 protease family, C-terminal catalytic domain containing protein [Parasponia andersonii]